MDVHGEKGEDQLCLLVVLAREVAVGETAVSSLCSKLSQVRGKVTSLTLWDRRLRSGAAIIMARGF